MRLVLSTLCIFSIPLASAFAGNVIEIAGMPIPQYTSNTCQSYSAAMLLAFRDDPAFKIDTLDRLRDAETKIRAEIEQFAKTRNHYSAGKLDPRHDDIMDGLARYTGGAYKLKPREFTNIVEANAFIAATTGISGAAPVAFPIAINMLKSPVMISTLRVGANTYGGGHLVTVLGSVGPNNNQHKYLVVNSAVKFGQGIKFFCDPEAPASRTTYGALTSWVDADVKVYDGGKIIAYTLEK